MALCWSQSSDVDCIDWFAIAIKDLDTHRHIGIFYQPTEDSVTKFCHLAWHCDLRNETADKSYAWVDSDLDETTRKLLANYVVQIVAANDPQSIPYSYIDFEDSFNPETAKYSKSGAGDGLTCATFILAIFELLGRQLINKSTWPKRESDKGFHQFVLSALEKSGATKEHLEAMQSSFGTIRIRPEEVAAAYETGAASWPVNADVAIPRGEAIVQELKAGPPPPPAPATARVK